MLLYTWREALFPSLSMRIFWINVLQLWNCFRDLHWHMYASYISDNIKCVWRELKNTISYALSAPVFVCRHTWLITPNTPAQRRWKEWPPHVRYSNHSNQINSDTKTASADKRVIMKINKNNEVQSLQILEKAIQKAGCSRGSVATHTVIQCRLIFNNSALL